MALIMFITLVAVFEVDLSTTFKLQIASGNAALTSEQMDYSITLQLVVDMIFWLVIFFVKASFLATYWALFNVSRRFRIAWWAVAFYTFASGWALFLAPLWVCGAPSKATSFKTCNDPSRIPPDMINLWWWMAVNVLGDVLIMVLPLGMLAKIRMSAPQRLGLAAIFAIGLIDVLFDVLRTVYNVRLIYGSWAIQVSTVVTLCEPAVAVMVCTLPSYRSLLPTQLKRRKRAYQHMLQAADRRSDQPVKLAKPDLGMESLV